MKGGYVDGFAFVVPKKNFAAYKKMATMASKIWKKHGALEYYECMGDDLRVKPMGDMKPRSFVEMTKAKPGDAVWFSFIVYKNRKHRDTVNAKVMKDPAMNDPALAKMPMPFDTKKMAYGGFKTIVTA